MSFKVVEFSFLTPEEFGADYVHLCDVAGLDPTDGGYGLIHLLDADDERISAISTDVEYVRRLVANLNDSDEGVEIAAERFSEQRAGWPDDWMAAAEVAAVVCPDCASTKIVRVPGGRSAGDGIDRPEPDARCLDCGCRWRSDPAVVDALGIDPEDVAEWIAAQLEVDKQVVEAVLGLEEEFQMAVGMIEAGPDTTFEHYDPVLLRGGPHEIDGNQLADDTERFLGISSEVAGDVLDAQMDYFVEVGLVDAGDWADAADEGPDLEELLDVIDWAANSASAMWATGRGLAAVIAELGAPDPDNTVPIPGLALLVAELEDACCAVCAVADEVVSLGDVGGAANATVADLVSRSGAALSAGGLAARRLAELCLGVTSYLPDDPRVTLAERAAVAALKLDSTIANELVDDGIRVKANDLVGLGVDLAGTLCRMIVDHDCVLTLDLEGVNGPVSIACTVDSVGNLELALIGPPDALTEELGSLGWASEPDGLGANWDDPLAVVEPVELIISTLSHLGLEDPSAVEFWIGRIEPGSGTTEMVWSVVAPALGGDPQLVVLPRDVVEHWMARLEALDCTTWGELRSTASEEVLDEMLGLCGYGTFAEFTANLDIIGAAPLPGAEAVAAEAFAHVGEPPADDAPFSPESIPAYCDGDWPPSVGYLIATELPVDLLDRYAEQEMTVFNGARAEIPATKADAVLSELAERGVELAEDDALELLVDLRA